MILNTLRTAHFIFHFYDHLETIGLGAAHLGWNTTLETLMISGTLQRRLAILFHRLCITCFITQAHYRVFTSQRRSYYTQLSGRQDSRYDGHEGGARRGNHDNSGNVRATRNWIRVGWRFGNNFVEGILAKCIRHLFHHFG